MGQKVHPTGFRLGIATDWTSKWYAEGRDYAQFLNSDLEIRKYLKEKQGNCGLRIRSTLYNPKKPNENNFL